MYIVSIPQKNIPCMFSTSLPAFIKVINLVGLSISAARRHRVSCGASVACSTCSARSVHNFSRTLSTADSASAPLVAEGRRLSGLSRAAFRLCAATTDRGRTLEAPQRVWTSSPARPIRFDAVKCVYRRWADECRLGHVVITVVVWWARLFHWLLT